MDQSPGSCKSRSSAALRTVAMSAVGITWPVPSWPLVKLAPRGHEKLRGCESGESGGGAGVRAAATPPASTASGCSASRAMSTDCKVGGGMRKGGGERVGEQVREKLAGLHWRANGSVAGPKGREDAPVGAELPSVCRCLRVCDAPPAWLFRADAHTEPARHSIKTWQEQITSN